MSEILAEVLKANGEYAAGFGDKEKLALPPARRFAILTCMDARLDPAKYAGLAEGDAHVIRNAGGRASDDAIRSLVISYKLLGTREFFVVHHRLRYAVFHERRDARLAGIESRNGAADLGGFSRHRQETRLQGWRIHRMADREGSAAGGARRRGTNPEHPLIPRSIPVYGYIYDVKSSKLFDVEGAKALGAAQVAAAAAR